MEIETWTDAELDAALGELPRHDVDDALVVRILAAVAAERAADATPLSADALGVFDDSLADFDGDELEQGFGERGSHELPGAAQLPDAQEAASALVAPGTAARGGSVWLRRAAPLVASAAALLFAASLVPDAAPEAAGPAAVTGAPGGLALKGAALAAPAADVRLGLSLLRDGGPVRLTLDLRPSDTLLLRTTTDRAGFAYLFRYDGALEVFHGEAVSAGTQHARSGGEVIGYPLGELTGEQVFGVAWSAEPWPAGADGPEAPAGLMDALQQGDLSATLDDAARSGVVVDARRLELP